MCNVEEMEANVTQCVVYYVATLGIWQSASPTARLQS